MDNNFNLNTQNTPKELTLLLEILKIRDYESTSFKKFCLDINWENFLHLARYHRVYSLIYINLKKINDLSIPPYVFQILEQEYKKNTFNMLKLCGEMEQLSKLFTENHIRLLFLKGPVIAADIYGDISLRTSKDLDILISKTDLRKADELLLNFGYIKLTEPTLLNEWKWKDHHFLYFHPKKKIQIEIHWRLHPPPKSEPSFNEVWKRKRKSTLTNYPVYFFGKEDLFLYLIAHGARHGWFRLRWLMDIEKIVLKGLDIKQINVHSDKYKICDILGQAFILISELLDTPINYEMQKLMESNKSRRLAQKAISFIKLGEFNYPKDYLTELKSNKEKILLIIMLIIPRSVDSQTLPLPKSLRFLYFPLRPFLIIWRKIRDFFYANRKN